MGHQRIDRSEWRWVALFASVVMLVTTIPYWLAWGEDGWLSGMGDLTFSGFFYGVEDGHSYLGKMRQGARGELSFSLFYTSEAHEAEPLVFLPYLLPGWVVGRVIDSDDPALTPALLGVFHLMRVVFGALMIAVIYAFVSRFLDQVRLRRLALALGVFGGGLGIIQMLVLPGHTPLEMYTPEAASWLILLGIPHLALARAALLGGLLALIDAQDQPRWFGRVLIAGLCWLITGLAVPFYLAILYCIAGAWGLAALIRTRRFPTALFLRAAAACGLTLPLFLHYAAIFTGNPAFVVWSVQNNLPSPPILDYLFTYGLIGVLALIAFFRLPREMERRFMLLIGWLAAVPFLVYLPINVQRRMSEAVLIPLAIFSAITLDRIRRLPRLVIIAALCSSSVVLLAGNFFLTGDKTYPGFQPTARIAAFHWLSAHAEPGAVIMTAVETGNALPAYADLRVFMGHGPETLYWLGKTAQLEAFYESRMTDAEILDLARHPCAPSFECEGPLRYIYYGRDEGNPPADGAMPRWVQVLAPTLIYSQDGVDIYEVMSLPEAG
ncbi:MAG: hypothetical protein HUU31_04625 [Anaerolineae bacterium]|nr:hypothetical protein [Anaerolineae bacterium]